MGHATDQNSHTHGSRDCNLCGTLRHPAQARDGAALRKHLATNPLPTQKGGRK